MACFAVSLLTSLASASETVGLRPGGSFRAVSEGSITFADSESELQAICRLTLSGEITASSLALSSFRRLPEGNIGKITDGRASECRSTLGGTVTAIVLATRAAPFTLRADSLLGTLPEWTGALLTALGAALQLTLLGFRCLYRGDLGFLAVFPAREEGGGTRYQSLSVLASAIRLREGAFCPRQGTLAGRFRLTPAQQLIAPGQLSVEPGSLDIPIEQNVGTLVVRNSAPAGSESLIVTGTAPIGGDFALFAVIGNTCNRPIPPGGALACGIDVAYTGTREERPKASNVRVTYSDGVTAGLIRDVPVRAE
ncbi:MAG: hypothetical protein WBC33_02330 [Conexibacter sp.]